MNCATNSAWSRARRAGAAQRAAGDGLGDRGSDGDPCHHSGLDGLREVILSQHLPAKIGIAELLIEDQWRIQAVCSAQRNALTSAPPAALRLGLATYCLPADRCRPEWWGEITRRTGGRTLGGLKAKLAVAALSPLTTDSIETSPLLSPITTVWFLPSPLLPQTLITQVVSATVALKVTSMFTHDRRRDCAR